MARKTLIAVALVVLGTILMLLGRTGGPNARIFLTAGVLALIVGLTILRQPRARPPGT